MHTFEVQQIPCRYITQQMELEEMVEQLVNEPLLAADTEFLRTNTFFPIVGLIQIASPSACFLIDPLTCDSLLPLKRLLYEGERRVVMHACSEDLEVLKRIYGDVPERMFDTQIAASMVSRDQQLGLQKLILAYCDIDIPKDETRSDWTKRPLTEGQMVYAALDVICLIKVYQALAEKLEALGRMAWCEEECQRMVDGYRIEPANESYYRGIGDAWKLKGKKLQVLQVIAQWREELAREKDKPRGFIFSDRELFGIADNLPSSINQLAKVSNFKPVQIRRYGGLLLEQVENALAAEDEELPLVPKPFNNRTKKMVKAVKPIVEKRAIELDMATDRLSNRRSLEKFVSSVMEGRELPGYFKGWRATELVPALASELQKLENNNSQDSTD